MQLPPFEPPQHYDDERREVWAETVRRLTAGGRIFRADSEVLNTYVEAVRSHRQASKLLAKTNVRRDHPRRQGGQRTRRSPCSARAPTRWPGRRRRSASTGRRDATT